MLDDGDSVSEAVARVEILGGPEGAGGGEHAHDAAARLQGGRLDRRLHPYERDVILLTESGDGRGRGGVAGDDHRAAALACQEIRYEARSVDDILAAFLAVGTVGVVGIIDISLLR